MQLTSEMQVSLQLIFMTSDKQSFISEFLKVAGPLREKFKIFISLGIKIKLDFNYINARIKLHPFRTLKQYLNDDNIDMIEKQQQFENLLHRIYSCDINCFLERQKFLSGVQFQKSKLRWGFTVQLYGFITLYRVTQKSTPV